jgi:hypothetical protein
MNDPFISSYEKRSVSFKIPPKMHQALKFYCLDVGITMQKIVETLIDKFVEEKGLLKVAKPLKKKVSKKSGI